MTQTETTVTSVLRDPIIIFGLALIALGVILLFTLPTETPGSFPLYIGIGLTAGRLSRVVKQPTVKIDRSPYDLS